MSINNDESTDLIQLKNLLYDTLTAEEEDSGTDVVANQNLGVNLTKAIKKDGVQIFQLQSVVNKKITNNVIKSLKIVDKLQEKERILPSPIQTPELSLDHVIQVIEWLASKNIPLKQFDKLMRGLYVSEIVSDSGNTSIAAERLGVSIGQVHKVKREGKEAIQILDDEVKQLEVVNE